MEKIEKNIRTRDDTHFFIFMIHNYSVKLELFVGRFLKEKTLKLYMCIV